MKKYQSTAVKSSKGYHHFGINPLTASLYGDKVEDIVNVDLLGRAFAPSPAPAATPVLEGVTVSDEEV